MKITLTQLRRLIREVLEEEADVPGRWRAASGEPIGDEDLERLGHGGFLYDLEEDDLEETWE